MKLWTTIGLCSLALVLSGSAFAGPRADRDGPRDRLPSPRMLDKLGLSDQQQEDLETLFLETRKAVIPLQSEVQLARLELVSLLKEEAPDEATVLAAVETVHAHQLEVKKVRTSSLLRARAIAGPEAWQAFQDLVRERGQKVGKKMRQAKRKARLDMAMDDELLPGSE